MYGPGALLADRYRLDERVGGGGMGEVWRATDQVLHRTVAVKVMRPELLEEPGFAERFLVEARIMATIRHPGVVGVHDYRTDERGGPGEVGGAFLVMEYVAGEALSRRLHRLGRLDPAVTMTLLAQAAEALQSAHDRGVVHRDIKPGNLLVTEADQLVLTDFGIARSAASTPLTATGAVIGTPSYLAPEVVLGKPATPRSDLYSLGVVAYECLAGRRPFEGDNPFEIAMKRLREPPPTLAVDAPAAVLAVVERALAPDPDQRWPSAAELAAAARQAAAGTAPGEPGAGAVATEPLAEPGPARGGTAPPGFGPGRAAVPEAPHPLPPTVREPAPASPTPGPPGQPAVPGQPPPGPPAQPRPPAQPPPGPPAQPRPPAQPAAPAPPPVSLAWPAAPARPPTVLVANLLLRVAACALIVYCFASLSVMDIVATQAEASFGADAEGTVGVVLFFGWAATIGLLLAALLLLLLAWRNNQGSRTARGWTFAIGFTLLCCCLPLGAAASNGGEAVDADRSEFERGLAEALPPWYQPVTGAAGLILAVALLAALVLLMLPPANRYYRLPPRPAFYYPYYLQYPYPPHR